MKNKMIRMSFEHAASYAADCRHHVYFVLAAADEDALAGRPSETLSKLQALAERVDVLVGDLSDVRKEIVDLRFAVEDQLSSAVVSGLSLLDQLDRDLNHLAMQTALLVRATRLRHRFPQELSRAEAAATLILDAVQAVRAAASTPDEPVWGSIMPAIAAIEALHDGVPHAEALAAEKKRWE
jgi:hypothetical protein